MTDFDVRRDVPTDETMKPRKHYRVTFAQDVTLLNDSHEAVCKLVAEPQPFIDSFQTAQWPGRSVAEGYTVMSPSIGGPAFFGNTRYGLVGPSSSFT